MGTPYLGEIRLMSFGFAPRYWALCNGQFLPINQNQALFALLGTMYGGNGQTTFALPDLRGRVPIHMGSGFTQGQQGGSQAHTLSTAELPAHSHWLMSSQSAATPGMAPDNAMLGTASAPLYKSPQQLVAMAADSVTNVGGSQAHLNLQPFLTLSFCISLQGIFPSQN